ncbi:MAG: hypothetical protein ACR2GH_07375 [Pseudonocardia sp.]
MSVVVFDLRPGEVDEVALADLEGAVLVLDRAESAVENDHVYQRLLGSPYISAVICMAVHDGARDRVEVRPPPSLGPAEHGAVLWIGHEHGIHWRPTDYVVQRVPPSEPSSLCLLIGVLHHPAAFHAVAKAVSALPFSTASPGMALEGVRLHETELRRVQVEAVTQFTDPDAGRNVAWELPRDEFRAAVREVVPIDRAEDVLVADGRLAAARTAAFAALETAEEHMKRLDDVLAPFTDDRPGREVVASVDRAYATARDFHEKATRQIKRIENSIRNRVTNEDTIGLGIYRAIEARPDRVRDQAKGIVGDWLSQYRSIGRFLPDLTAERTALEPQGRHIGLAGLESLTPPSGPPPAFLTWPPATVGVPLVAVSGVLAALGVVPAVVLPVLALVWFAAGLFLHARQPTEGGEQGVVAALKPAFTRWLLPMIVGGLLGSYEAGASLPGPLRLLLTVVAGLGLVGTVAVSWRRSVRAWRRGLGLDRLKTQMEQIDSALEEALRVEWRPSANRALLAEGLRQASVGMTTISEVLVRKAEGLLTSVRPDVGVVGDWGEREDATPDRDVYQQIREVIVADLADLTVSALSPCWEAIEAGRADPPVELVEKRTEELLTEYREHVQRNGLLVPPPFARVSDRRDVLAVSMWRASDVGGALATASDEEMVQLCHAEQLHALQPMAEGAVALRVAPDAVRAVPDLPGPVIWTGDTDVAGMVRLVPLRQGVFE